MKLGFWVIHGHKYIPCFPKHLFKNIVIYRYNKHIYSTPNPCGIHPAGREGGGEIFPVEVVKHINDHYNQKSLLDLQSGLGCVQIIYWKMFMGSKLRK